MVREDALLHAHHPYAVELEPLRRVQRHQPQHVFLRLVVLEAVFLLFDLEDKVVEKAADHCREFSLPRPGSLVLVECCRHLLDARPTGLGLGRIVLVFLGEKRPVASRVEEAAEHRRRPRLPGHRGRSCVAEGHESGHRIDARPGCRRQSGRVAAGEQFPPQAMACGGRVGPRLLHGRSGEAPRWHVGNPRERQVVVGIDQHPQERHHVLDLAAVEKRVAADEFVGNLPPPEFLFEGPRLFAGADEDHRLGGLDEPLAKQALDVGDNAARLVHLVLGLDDRRWHARRGV